MKRVLITGANRGIGLEVARQLLARGERVFATCRRPDEAADLHSLQATYPDLLTLTALDVRDAASLDAAHAAIRKETPALDWLINNAGVNAESDGMGDARLYTTLGKLDADALLDMWRVNAAGPLMVTQHFVDLLKAGDAPRVVNISSGMGSLAGRTSGGSYGYAASKAALNMLARALAFDLLRQGIVVITLNPGWVKTDMGGRGAPLRVEESARGIIAVTDGLTRADAGRFLRYDGAEVAW